MADSNYYIKNSNNNDDGNANANTGMQSLC